MAGPVIENYKIQDPVEPPRTKLKSLRANEPTHVCFVSRTTRPVEIIWLNYVGDRISYKIIQSYGEEFSVKTFVTHPWIFRDKNTRAVIHGNNQEIYHPPKKRADNVVHCVQLGIPVYSLKEICLQDIRKNYYKTEIESMENELPQDLIKDLLDWENPERI